MNSWPKTLSIVIVTWNCREHIEACLKSLDDLRLENFETIVVDNNSRDGTSEFLRTLDHEMKGRVGLKLICRKANAGLSQASAEAISKASGEWILSCNPDIEFTEDFKKMLKYARSNNFPILGAQLVTPDGTVQNCMRQINLPRLFFALTRLGRFLDRIISRRFFLRDIHYGNRTFDQPVLVDHPIASFFMIRHDAVQDLRYLFSNDLPVYFGDTDLFRRAQERKMPMVFLPSVRIMHKVGYSTQHLRSEIQQFMFVNGMIRYAKKWNIFPRFLATLLFLDALLAPLTSFRPPSKADIRCASHKLKGIVLA